MTRPQAGFSLIEVLLALLVCSSALVIAMQGLSLGWRSTRAAGSEAAALSLGRSLLAQAGGAPRLEPGRSEGESGGIMWSVEIKEHEAQALSVDPRARASQRAYWIEVELSWREGVRSSPRGLRLVTMRKAGER